MTVFLFIKIVGVWLILVALLLRGNHRAHRRRVAAEEPKLPINHIYYANRYGVFRYEGEDLRRFAAEYDLLEQRQGGEL